MATPPTFVAEYEVAPSVVAAGARTVSVTVGVGDVLAIYGLTESNTYTLATPTGGGLTYTLQQSVVVVDYCTCYMWTAISASSQTFTLSITMAGGTGYWGYSALRFSGSDGVGASTKTNVLSGGPSLALTTGTDNAAIVVGSGDWNAVDGASRTWRTINSVTPTAGNNLERTYARDSSRATFYGAYWSDAGTAGSKTTGISAPTGQKYSIIAVEIKGTAGGGTDATATPAVLAVTVALPSSALNVGAGPATVAATTALPSGARNIGAGPAVLPAVAALARPDVNVGAGPAVIPVVVSLPQVTVSAGGSTTVAPATVAATVSLPAAGASVGAGPATVPVVVTLPAAGGAVGSAPATIATTVTLPAATPDVGAGPATVAALVSLPAGAVSVGAGPVTVPVVVTLPTPGAGSNTVASPAAVTATVSLPAAAVDVGAGPAVVPVTVTVPLVGILGTQANATSAPTVTAVASSVAAVTALRTSTPTVTDT